MPTYNYRRISTGEEWTEFRSISERDIPLEDPDVELGIMAPRVMATDFLSTTSKGDTFRRDILEPKIKALNPRGLKHP